jgi:hypothetical protein
MIYFYFNTLIKKFPLALLTISEICSALFSTPPGREDENNNWLNFDDFV